MFNYHIQSPARKLSNALLVFSDKI